MYTLIIRFINILAERERERGEERERKRERDPRQNRSQTKYTNEKLLSNIRNIKRKCFLPSLLAINRI